MKTDTNISIDAGLVRLDARLGALELLIRNLYVQRFLAQPEPLNAVESARDSLALLMQKIQVCSPDPAKNDLLASEAEEFLGQMFGEIVEIIRHDVSTTPHRGISTQQ